MNTLPQNELVDPGTLTFNAGALQPPLAVSTQAPLEHVNVAEPVLPLVLARDSAVPCIELTYEAEQVCVPVHDMVCVGQVGAALAEQVWPGCNCQAPFEQAKLAAPS